MMLTKIFLLFAVLLTPTIVRAASAQPEPPYVGVSYYPEVAGDQMDDDIALMRDMGVNLVRFGEFAWSRMETKDGEFNFAWLHAAVKQFSDAGIAVQLCTPTATPPVWLSEAHPDILRLNAFGQTIGHGGRRQYCPNSPTYLSYAVRIANKMGEEFGSEPGVIAWQIDNELWEDCYCANCEKAFHAWLKNHFGTIENLNSAWLTVLWSQEYQSFDQVPLPNPQRVGAGHHPSLVAAYRHFMSDSYVAFCDAQAKALRRHTKKGVTTNAHNPAYQQIDYADLFRDLDLVSTDSYAGPNDLMRYAFEADWMRPLKKPFWLAETASTHSAGTAVDNASDWSNFPGALRAKMWLTYALGGDAVSFWLWRAHGAGQELEHGSLLYPWGDECTNTPEIRRAAAELKTNAAWLRATKPAPAKVALTYGLPSQWQFTASPIALGFSYDAAITAFHRMLAECGISRDVIMPGGSVDGYQTVFSPYFPALDAATLKSMKSYVEQGGTWVLGPLSACRTTEATAHRDACYGADFEKWLGIHVRHRSPPGSVTRLATEKETVSCQWWCDAYETSATQRVLARYSGGPLDGYAAIVECPIGQGRVILLGTQPEDRWLRDFLKNLAPETQASADAGVIIAPRVTSEGKPAGCVVVNTHATAAQFQTARGAPEKIEGFGVKILPW
ncbi:MAG: beta-galactosidase [Verrucomicrobiota bacterium]